MSSAVFTDRIDLVSDKTMRFSMYGVCQFGIFSLDKAEDLALVLVHLLCLILTLAAVARYVPRLRRLVPWSRELGIAMFVTAGLHVLILLEYSVGFGSLFSFEDLRDAFFGAVGFVGSSQGFLGGDSLYTAANWVGLFALGYALVLAATSNDFSQRLLGRGWKFTQRQTYTLFVLVWLHTAVFLVDLDRWPPVFTWFWMFTILAVVTQMSGFVHTVRSTRGPSPQRAPKKTRTATSRAAAVAAAQWVAVAALWGGVIIGSWALATTELRNEDKMLALFCERYDELEGLPRSEIRDKLIDFLPADEPVFTFGEWAVRCQDG